MKISQYDTQNTIYIEQKLKEKTKLFLENFYGGNEINTIK